ncbi:trypsin domain-containing protein [Phthorimaea operculella]|nr:trypsin domain-containing protein [Phthorimaea operculella]
MGAGQIGGLATLLDIDFNNAAGFVGENADIREATYVVYFLSHTMLFCTGALIEAHVVLTAASCVYGERYRFEVFGGTHLFLEGPGVSRKAEHMAVHKGYNHTMHWTACSPDNIALLLLKGQFHMHERESGADFVTNRLRYGGNLLGDPSFNTNCRFYGWGSRRNGYLIPLLLKLRRVDVTIMRSDQCHAMWNHQGKYLCLRQFRCKSEAHGALCPDDIGSVVECSGFLRGMMASRLIDRPCGVGFLDMSQYLKFLTCGVDDARDILGHDDFMEFEIDQTTARHAHTHHIHTVPNGTFVGTTPADNDPGPPTLHSTVSGEEPEMDPEVKIPQAEYEVEQEFHQPVPTDHDNHLPIPTGHDELNQEWNNGEERQPMPEDHNRFGDGTL